MIRVLELFGEPILNGGQESFAINVVNALNPQKFHIDFLTPYVAANKKYSEILKKRGSYIYSLNLNFNPGGMKFNVLKPIIYFLKDHKYDIVHINSGSTFFLAVAAYAAKHSHVKKVIVHSHSSGYKENLKHLVIKKIAQISFYFNADKICAPTIGAAKWKFSSRLIKKKLVIIKNGIDIQKFKFSSIKRKIIRKKLGINDQTLVLGHVGRFTTEKNQIFLIRLIKCLKNKKVKLILVGNGDNLLAVKRFAKKQKIRDQVMFLGRRSNPEDFMQAFDIFLLPSLYEGLGLVAIEAQCSGLPIIVSNTVPKEIKLTPYVYFKSLDRCADWIKEIKKCKCMVREDESYLVKKAGYSLETLRKQIVKLYTL